MRAAVSNGSSTLGHVTLDHVATTRLLNEPTDRVVPDDVLVVSDTTFQAWSRHAPPGAQFTVASWLTPQWQSLVGVATDLSRASHNTLSLTVTSVTQVHQIFAALIFAGFFLSFLFFLACASTIYFRLQAQREADRIQLHALQRLDVERRELKRQFAIDLSLLFGAPLVVAIGHSVVAMTTFTDLLHLNAAANPGIRAVFMGVAVGYVAAMGIYFLVAYHQSTTAILSDAMTKLTRSPQAR